MAESVFVSPAWLAERLGRPGLAVVDASWYLPAMNRDAGAEYRAGHIPGAVRFDIEAVRDAASPLPHMLPAPEDFAAAVSALGIGDDSTIVVYDGLGLFAAARAWWTFRVFGARSVFILEGGFPAWRAAGLPVESGEPAAPAAGRFTPRLDRAAVADAGAVAEALATGSAQVIDARSVERFRGEAPEPRPGLRSGHIPGSFNLPWDRIVEKGRLKPEASLRAAFAQAGLDFGRPVVTTCGSGVSAAILWVALAGLGHPPQALYDGSWAEWGADPDRPVGAGS